MLEQFLHQNDIDILLVQKVTNTSIQNIRGYTSYLNVGTTKRSTAIIVKEPLSLSDISILPSGRGIAANYKGLWIINVYAPSGAEKKNRERNVLQHRRSIFITWPANAHAAWR
jgi:exonuclease III